MYSFLVTTARGLDELLQKEVQSLLPEHTISQKPGQVRFDGELVDAYTVCLWSRLANRVLLELDACEVKDADDLYQLAMSIDWLSHFSVQNSFVIDFLGTNRVINNSQFGALKVKDAIADQFNQRVGSRPNISKQDPDIRIQCRLHRDKLTIYIDLSGKSLHQRYYRKDTGRAPLKEHVAAAILMRSGWTEDMQQPLIDPMCGSGTVIIEAALMATNTAPALKRNHWGFTEWKGHQAELWYDLVAKAHDAQTTTTSRFFANDIDGRLMRIARVNAADAKVESLIQFSHNNALNMVSPVQQTGYMVSNPPYGERLNDITDLLPMFAEWGVHLKKTFKDWKVSLLTSNREVLKELRLVSDKHYKLMNGKLECQLVNYRLDEKNCEVWNPGNEMPDNDFANRLKKNKTKLKKWLKNANTDCYRVYDADLPEYNAAVDIYGDFVVLQEYAAPKEIDPAKTKKRLQEMLRSLAPVLQVPNHNVVLKVREQKRGKAQYEKLATQANIFTVQENGAQFEVNLSDYLDTGLFLDHRDTRKLIQTKAKDKHVLNLFAYTGSVSVHAALGGAASVTTVDMSNTYLDWAKRNFTLNKLRGPYQFVQADCLQWIAEHQQGYDLLFIDPPSFSNSKRMSDTWDVQRDHVTLLRNALKCLNPGGEIIFSNNLRQFKMDITALQELGLTVENISAKTLPEDYKRNPKIHNCWLLKHDN